jgi:lysine 2,3-aminomutase
MTKTSGIDIADKCPAVSAEVALQNGMTEGELRVFNYLQERDPETPQEILDWEDWRWQLRHRIRTKEVLSDLVHLTQEEEIGIDRLGKKLSLSISPYFASLIDPDDPTCPVRRQCIPLANELEVFPEEMTDPCGEEKNSPVPGLVHRYPDRVLFLVTEMCATYCRYCTRSRMVGDGRRNLGTATYEAAFDYIRSNPKIRDVLLSGGDPLTLSDSLLEYLIKNIKEIPHVEFVRLGTRMPVTLPQRITGNLVRMLKRYNPIWMSIHFNHAKEITARVKRACDLLADSGIPLGSQTVLLKGINDDPAVMKKLVQELLKIRVRPYYIYQCDPVVGTKHFRTPISVGIKIIEQLRGHTTGYAVPTYVIDAPGGGGKIPIGPNYVVTCQEGKYILRNYEGQQFEHIDP